MIRRKKGKKYEDSNHLEMILDGITEEPEAGQKPKKVPFWKRKKESQEEFKLYDDIEYIEEKDFDRDMYQNEQDVFEEEEIKQNFDRTLGEEEQIEEESPDNVDEIEDEKESKKIPKKKLLILAGAAVIIIGAISYFMVKNINSGDEGKAYVESVRVVAGLGSANGINNRYTGEVEAQDSWKITLQSDMSVEKCFVSVGDEVKKGDKLFSYNTEELTLAKEKKELEVSTLENENTQLNKDIKSYQEDLKSASASEKIELQTQILTAQTTIKKNEYSIKSGKEEIKTLESNIKDATVKSKMDGVVKSINTSVGAGDGDDTDAGDGDDTDAGMSDEASADGSTYMTILAVGDYRIKGKISETNVWSIDEGDPVIVRSRVDDTTWKGTISKVKTDSTSDETDSESTDSDMMDYGSDMSGSESASSYNFYVELNDDEGLMMGQHVFIELDYGQDEGKEGIWIPAAYVRVEGDNYYVWVANKRDRLEKKKIEVGEYNEDLDEYQILSGLDENDYIACDAENLKENMKTTKVDSEADSTGEYYEEETSDDELYDDEDYIDEDYSEEDLMDEDMDSQGLIDEGISEDGFYDE